MTRFSGISSGACCSALGCHGHILGAIQSPYDGSLLSMRVGCQCGPSQGPTIGLRQGCPLSATLFGIFIDGLHHHLQTSVPAAGVQVRHIKLTDLVYADDICLMASSPEPLQALIRDRCFGCLLCYTTHGDQCGKNKGDGGLQAFCQIAFFCGQCFHMQWPASGAC